MGKRWVFKNTTKSLAVEGVSDILLDLLAARGVQTGPDVAEFLSMRPQRTYDPLMMKNMEQAAEAVLDAIRSGIRICVYGDYDTDGVTAICLMLEFLGQLTNDLAYYIPSRFEEGYGLNREAIDSIRQDGAGLILTVDCGSTAHEEVEYAKSIGLQVIVTDHHNVNERAADCILVNPKQEGCSYPFKELCGCGVAFKLAQAIQRRAGLPRSAVTRLLDLVAIATIGDIVPLVDENRTLVKYGMEQINAGHREAIDVLAAAAGLEARPITSHQIAYVLVPHLNAAGRMAEADAGVRLLTADSRSAMLEAARTLVSNNTERKRIQEEDYRKCLRIAENHHAGDHFLVIEAADVHEGIAGIVAGKIKDAFGRPAVILTGSGELYLKGTGRSTDGINIYEMLKRHAALFIKFGGHSGACGFLMESANLGRLREGLNAGIREIFEEDGTLFDEKLMIDRVLVPSDIDQDLVRSLERLEPFGHRNEKPNFLLEDVRIEQVHHMGEDGQHARFTISGASGSTDCILFGTAANYSKELVPASRISLVGYPDRNTWNGTSKIQFVVRDLRCYSINVE